MPAEEAVTYAFKPKLKWSKVEVGLHVNLGLHIKASQLSYLCIISPFRVQRSAFSVTSVLQRTKICTRLSNCKLSNSNPWPSCFSAAVLYLLSYENLYIGSKLVCWADCLGKLRKIFCYYYFLIASNIGVDSMVLLRAPSCYPSLASVALPMF